MFGRASFCQIWFRHQSMGIPSFMITSMSEGFNEQRPFALMREYAILRKLSCSAHSLVTNVEKSRHEGVEKEPTVQPQAVNSGGANIFGIFKNCTFQENWH